MGRSNSLKVGRGIVSARIEAGKRNRWDCKTRTCGYELLKKSVRFDDDFDLDVCLMTWNFHSRLITRSSVIVCSFTVTGQSSFFTSPVVVLVG